MATHTCLPTPTTTADQHAENKPNEGLKAVTQEVVTSSKESGETNEEHKAQPEELADAEPSVESEKKMDAKQVEPSSAVEVEKAEKVHIPLDIPAEDGPKVTGDTDPKLGVSSVSEPAVKDVEKDIEEELTVSDTPKSQAEALGKAIEPSEVPKQGTEPEVENKPEPDVGKLAELFKLESETIDNPVPVVDKSEVLKEPEQVSQLESNEVKVLEPVVEVEEKPQEQPEVEKMLEIVEPSEVTKQETKFEVKNKPEPELGKLAELLKLESETVETPVPVEEISDVLKEPEQVSQLVLNEVKIVEPVVEVEEKPQEQPEIEKMVEIVDPSEVPKQESEPEGETKREPALKETEVLQSEPETVENPLPVVEKLEVLKEPEQVLRSESDEIEKLEPVTEEKPQEQPEVEKKSEIIEAKEVVDTETAKDKEITADTLKEEELAKGQESIVDTNASADQEAPSNPQDKLLSVLPDVSENTDIDNPPKEKTQVDVVKEFNEEAAAEVGKVEEEKEEKSVKKESTQPETSTIEAVNDTQSEIDGETSRDVEVVAEEKKEDITAALAETTKSDIEGNVEALSSFDTAKEAAEQPKQLEVKEDAVETDASKLEEVAEETTKSDALPQLSPKDIDEPKAGEEPPKQEVPPKPAQKQSNNLMSKVKQSLVKVKKAIIGKSPSSKTLSSEPKSDIQVK